MNNVERKQTFILFHNKTTEQTHSFFSSFHLIPFNQSIIHSFTCTTINQPSTNAAKQIDTSEVIERDVVLLLNDDGLLLQVEAQSDVVGSALTERADGVRRGGLSGEGDAVDYRRTHRRYTVQHRRVVLWR